MRRLALALACVLAASAARAQEALVQPKAQPATLASGAAAGARVGAIRLLGILELHTPTIAGLRFAELSGLAWDADENILYAITDQGGLFWLRPQLRNGLLEGLDVLKAVPLREANGKPVRWRRSDSEGLTVLNARNGRRGDSELLVSFERIPRIVRYRPDGTWLGELPLPAPLADAGAYPGSNRSLEAVTVHPHHGVLTVPEGPLPDPAWRDHRLFGLSGAWWGLVSEPQSDITAIEWVDGIGLLILERRYGVRTVYPETRLLRVRDLPQQSGAMLSPETVAILKSRTAFEHDNFEGLTHHEGRRFFMVTDDNDAILQRTLLVYFELVEP